MSLGRTLKKIFVPCPWINDTIFCHGSVDVSRFWKLVCVNPKNVNYFKSESHTIRQAIDPVRLCTLARDSDMMYQLGDYLDASVVE